MDFEQLAEHKRHNTLQTLLLIVGMALILGALGYALLNVWGAVAAMILACFVGLTGSRIPASVVLRMFRARPIFPEYAPELLELHTELCRRAQLSHCPGLYYIPSRAVNAFATGSERTSAVAITDGLLRILTPRELAGVLAHEIAHLKNRDLHILSLADTFSRVSSTISRVAFLGLLFLLPQAIVYGSFSALLRVLVILFAPALCTLLQLALSRSREFQADTVAAELTFDPQGLASALHKLDRLQPKGWLRRLLYPGNPEPQPTALRTHPPTRERIEKLMEMVPQYQQPPDVMESTPRSIYAPRQLPPVRQRPTWHWGSGLWY